MKKSHLFVGFTCVFLWTGISFSQKNTTLDVQTARANLNIDSIPTNLKSGINNINNSGMPNRISMNVSVPKQTQGATFGEKVNAGLQAAGSAISQGVSLVTISGNLWFDKIEFPNTVTIVSSVGNLAGSAGGGAAAASYAATGMIIKPTDEIASGISTVLTARERGSGMASGKRQYQPIYISKDSKNCENCLVTLKKSSVTFEYDIKKNQVAKTTNPYFKNNELQGDMPPLNKSIATNDNDCDGVQNVNILLINTTTGQEVGRTQTGKCGQFSFNNIPTGTYSVQLIGVFLSKRGYEYYMAKSVDIKGKVLQNDETFKLILRKEDELLSESSVVKTKTKSNQSNDRLSKNNEDVFIVKLDQSYADIDNDGTVDLLVGGTLPGGQVLSSAFNAKPGNPIGGLSIKGGKNPGGNIQSKTTNPQGEFEFLNLEPGNYQFVIDRTVTFNATIQLELTHKTKHDTVKNSIQNIR